MNTKVAILSAVIVLALADSAWAWGPAMHIGMGSALLEHMAGVPAALAGLLLRHRVSFLFGNIAADIVFAKKLSRTRQFCHHWSTGFTMLDHADRESDRAFALGYLSHLAADTVAHGKFVPRQVLLSQMPLTIGHFFWELRADAAEPNASRTMLEEVVRSTSLDEHHKVLEERLKGTLFPHDVNRALFERMNALSFGSVLQRGVGLWNVHSRWYLSTGLIDQYRDESVDRMIAILTEGRKSALVREDPNGTSVLMQVAAQRRDVRRLKRRGVPVQQRVMETCRAWAPSKPRPHESSP